MSTKQFYHDIDLVNVGQLIGARIQNVTTSARNALGTTFTNGTPTDHIGVQVWDTDIDAPFVWDGSAWVRDALVVNGDVIFQGTVDASSSLDAQATATAGYQYAVSTAGTLSMTGVTFSPSAVAEVGDMVLFTSGTAATVLQRNLDNALVDADFSSAGIMATNGSGTYSIITDNSANWNAAYNDKINSASFATGTGILTLTQQDSGTVTVDLDGRYHEQGVDIPDADISLSSVTQHLDVLTVSASGGGALSFNSSNGSFTFTPPDLSSYLTSEVNDLTSSVTWANVPDANITQSSVTQHQAALSINESQISFTSSFIELGDLDVLTAAASGGGALTYNNANGSFTFTPPDLSSYLTSETNDLTAAVTWANVPDANITESSVTQHEGALSIGESQITPTTALTTTASDFSGGINELDGEIGDLTSLNTDDTSSLVAAINELEGEVATLQLSSDVAIYTATGVSITASTPLTVNHNLALSDKDFFTIRVCDTNGSSISVDVDSVNTNSLTLTSLVDLTGIKIVIFGVPS